MPAPNVTDPDSLRTRARTWLADHPGNHRPREVADDLGLTDPADRRRLANELARLARDGLVLRARPADTPGMGPGVFYSHLPQPASVGAP